METTLEHNISLVWLASQISGLPEDQILKARETPDGGIVVIDHTGSKQTFTSLQLAQYLQQVVNGRRVQKPPALIAYPTHTSSRQNAGRKSGSHSGARPNAGRKPIHPDTPPVAGNEP